MANIAGALTTRQKVKDMMNITDNLSDSLIDSYIRSMTAFVQNYCGGRVFVSTSYVEIKDTHASNKLFLNQRPATLLTTLEYRAGTISAPIWMTYDVNSYYQYLTQGYLQFPAKFQPAPQVFRVSYTAGYLIDFDNEDDTTKHTLPFDLTNVCTELIGKKLNTRLSQGIYTETTEGQSITYESDRYQLNDDHKVILNQYKLNRVSV